MEFSQNLLTYLQSRPEGGSIALSDDEGGQALALPENGISLDNLDTFISDGLGLSWLADDFLGDIKNTLGDDLFEDVYLIDISIADPENIATSPYVSLGIRVEKTWDIIPDVLAIQNPQLVITATTSVSEDGAQTIRYYQAAAQGAFVVGDTGARLTVFLELPSFQLKGYLEPDQSVSLTALMSHFGDIDVSSFGELNISELYLLAKLTKDEKQLAFSLEIEDIWQHGAFALQGLSFKVQCGSVLKNGSHTTSYNAGASVMLGLGGVSVRLGAVVDNGNWVFSGSAATGSDELIPIGDLVTELTAIVGLDDLSNAMPDALKDLCIRDVQASFSTSDHNFYLKFVLQDDDGSWEVIPGILSLGPGTFEFNAVPGFLQGSISGDVTLGDYTLHTSLSYPFFVGSAELTASAPIAPLLERLDIDGSGFDKLTINTFSILYDNPNKYATLHLQLDNALHIESVGIDITDVELLINYRGGKQGGLSASLHGIFEYAYDEEASTEETDDKKLILEVSAEHPGPGEGWQFSGQLAVDPGEDNPLSPAHIFKRFGDEALTSLMEVFLGWQVTFFGISYDTLTRHFQARMSIVWAKDDSDTPDDSEAVINLNIDKLGAQLTLSGQLLTQGMEFDLIFGSLNDEKNLKHTVLAAVFANPGGGGVNIIDLIGAFTGQSLDLGMLDSLTIKDALFAYEGGNAKSAGKKEPVYVFTMDMDAGIDLSGLGNVPLVGKYFSGDSSLKLSFSPTIALTKRKTPTALSATELSGVQGLLPSNAPQLPSGDGNGLKKNLSLQTQVQIAGVRKEINLSGDDENQFNPSDNPGLGQTNTQPAVATPPAMGAAKNIKWINVQKALGPIHIARVGLAYKSDSKQITMLLDAGLNMGGLTLALYGLGATYDIDDQNLTFALEGLGIDFKRGMLEIGAAFLRIDDDYMGRAIIRTSKFSLSALGAYSKYQGHPSLFIYGVLLYPIGGPVFFFVEGLAAGFGYNRHLQMPTIDQVYRFPLIQEATGQSAPPPALTGGGGNIGQGIREELTRLHAYISPSVGEYFLALGIKFNSFRLIDSFLLLMISVKTGSFPQFMVYLLGLATAKIPPPPSKYTLAEIQLALMATIDPQSGSVLVRGVLTPNSWIISPDARLSGGFAYGVWFFKGDFVQTFGGYHPDFTPPDYYPRVNRLALSWHFSDYVSIKADAYYALTPVAIMAGGHLNATWHSGDLQAYFKVGADFLIQWKPFFYSIGVSVEIGASYKCPLGFRISGSLSAKVKIWGPEFAGSAHFKFGPVSFSVEFGDSDSDEPDPIDWDEFQESFLPQDKDSIVSITAHSGLLRTVKVPIPDGDENREWWMINPKEFLLDVSSILPTTEFEFVPDADQTKLDDLLKDIQVAKNQKKFGIAPMQRKDTPSITTAIFVGRFDTTRAGDNDVDHYLDDGKYIRVDDEFSIAQSPKSFPAGLWGQGKQGLKSKALIDGVGGLLLKPAKLPKPGKTAAILRRNLNFTIHVKNIEADSAEGTVSGYDQLKDTISPDKFLANENRADILAAFGFDVVNDIRLKPDLLSKIVSPIVVNIAA